MNTGLVKMQVLPIVAEQASQVEMIDPKLCKPWNLSNRDLNNVTEESCLDLINSIKSQGQQIPVLVRAKEGSEEYELIFGVRRLFACKFLGIKVKASCVNISDKDALLAMDSENRQREDISPYERACDYKRWLEQGIYKSYREIIAALGVKKSWFSQLIALAELDKNIIKAFEHPANLKLKWGYNLHLTCQKNASIKTAMLQLAKELSGKSLAPAVIYRRLKNVLISEDKFSIKNSILITDRNKKNIFTVKYSETGNPRFVFTNNLPDSLLEKIILAAKNLIEENGS